MLPNSHFLWICKHPQNVLDGLNILRIKFSLIIPKPQNQQKKFQGTI